MGYGVRVRTYRFVQPLGGWRGQQAVGPRARRLQPAGCGGVRPMNLTRSLEKLATTTANVAWPVVKKLNRTFERPSLKPKWAPAPLLKSRERTFPQLGWPRTTDSLC